MLVLFLSFVTLVSANSFLVKRMHFQTNVLCSDGKTRCPTDHECCRLELGKIGCCLQQEIGQEIHNKHGWNEASSLKSANLTVDFPCPNPSYTCPGLKTCCCSGSGCGCCPYDRGTCCSDGQHCCPSGAVCVANICY